MIIRNASCFWTHHPVFCFCCWELLTHQGSRNSTSSNAYTFKHSKRKHVGRPFSVNQGFRDIIAACHIRLTQEMMFTSITPVWLINSLSKAEKTFYEGPTLSTIVKRFDSSTFHVPLQSDSEIIFLVKLLVNKKCNFKIPGMVIISLPYSQTHPSSWTGTMFLSYLRCASVFVDEDWRVIYQPLGS